MRCDSVRTCPLSPAQPRCRVRLWLGYGCRILFGGQGCSEAAEFMAAHVRNTYLAVNAPGRRGLPFSAREVEQFAITEP